MISQAETFTYSKSKVSLIKWGHKQFRLPIFDTLTVSRKRHFFTNTSLSVCVYTYELSLMQVTLPFQFISPFTCVTPIKVNTPLELKYLFY